MNFNKNIMFIMTLLIGGLISCSQHEEKECCSKNASLLSSEDGEGDFISEMSLYNLDSEWTDQNGNVIDLFDLQGKVQLVAMIYTECAYACPRIIADLQRIEDALTGIKKEELGITLITMDPERDTPQKLKAFAKKNKLDPKRWTILTSEEANILELAALLNVKYKKESNGNIAHSNIITVLDRNGEIINQQEGLGIDPDETVNAIKSLLAKAL
jgi:protein SCO1